MGKSGAGVGGGRRGREGVGKGGAEREGVLRGRSGEAGLSKLNILLPSAFWSSLLQFCLSAV